MASSSALTTVQKLYIAYYGRAADGAGQQYWADQLDLASGSLVGIVDAFANAPEAQALYGSGTTPTERIAVLYQNILGRAPDPAGLDYYAGEVNSGRLSLGNAALAILDGVQGDDVPLADHRLIVANSFTAQVSPAPLSYDGDAAAAIARTFLKQVTGEPATVAQANDQLAAWLNTIGVASKQGDKFAPLIANGLLTNTAIVSTTLTEDNLDAAIAALLSDTTPPVAMLVVAGGEALTVQLEAIGNAAGNDESPQLTAVGADGALAVTWQGIDAQGDGSIFVQSFNADGSPTGRAPVQLRGSELANTGNFGPQIQAFGSTGASVVAWTGFKSTTSTDTAIFVQGFHADGTTAGYPLVQLEAPEYPNGIDGAPQITALPSGGFMVSWEGTGTGLYDRVFLQAFNADGNRASDTPTELPAIDRPSGHDEQHQLAALGASGNLAVVWQGSDVMVNGAGYDSIYAQVLNASGQPLRQPAVLLNGSGLPDGSDLFPRIAAVGSGGAFVVTWYGYESAGDASIFVQMFNADGSTTGHPTVRLEAIGKTNGDDYEPQITAIGSNGEFVVTWWGEDNDGELGDGSIFVQKFNADGTTTGQTPVQLEAIGRTNGDDRSPQIAAVGTQGEFVVTWYGRDDILGDESIFVQKFNANGTTTGQTPVQLEAVGESQGDDYQPQIAAVGSQGEFAVTWHGQDSEGDLSVFVQKFTADGRPLGRSVDLDGSASLTVRSTEPGMAYLVNTRVAVGTVADITGAADALWNAVTVATADTDTALSAAGLEAGSYQLYTADGAGNLSAAAIATVQVTGTVNPLQNSEAFSIPGQ